MGKHFDSSVYINWLQEKKYKKSQRHLSEIVNEYPGEAEAFELYGLSFLLSGEVESALDPLHRAVKLNPREVRYLSNYGEALRKSGRWQDAMDVLEEAVGINPNYLPAKFNLACVLLTLGRPKKALQLLQYLIGQDNMNLEYVQAMADCLRLLGRIKAAIAHYQKALDISADYAPAHSNLGPLLLETGRIDDALVHCRLAVELNSQNGLSWLNLGRCLTELEQYDEAMDALANAFELIPDNPSLLVLIAENWLKVDDYPQAEHWYQQALQVDTESEVAKIGLANTYKEVGLTEKALALLDEVLEACPESVSAKRFRAMVLMDMGQTAASCRDFEDIILQKPQQASFYAAYGNALETGGDLEKAKMQFTIALDKNPNCVPALFGLATLLKGNLPIKIVEQIESLINHKELRDGAKSSLNSALSYYYDGTKDFQKAASHIEQANAFKWRQKSKQGWDYQTESYEQFVDQVINTFNHEYFASLLPSPDAEKRPVFIVGMPRSGTTLTEQILNAHPEILGVGELSLIGDSFQSLTQMSSQTVSTPFQVIPFVTKENRAELATWHMQQLELLVAKSQMANPRRIVDKMPDNFNHIGWILSLFPNAYIIHIKRDVRDVAVSCWMTQFAKIKWSSQLEHLAHRVIQYDRLMKHWYQVIPDKIIAVEYKNLVMNQEGETARLLKAIEMPWSDQCLQFHQQSNVIKTASVNQVRKPIYKKSLNRWERYENVFKDCHQIWRKSGVDVPYF